MKDFLFVYRYDLSQIPTVSAEERQATTKRWMDWIGSIAAQNKLGDRGNRLDTTGRVLKANQIVTNGPYAEIKESIGGYTLIKATSYEEAIGLAEGCPVLTVGGNVEIREISPLQ